jgi:hypothetical protein
MVPRQSYECEPRVVCIFAARGSYTLEESGYPSTCSDRLRTGRLGFYSRQKYDFLHSSIQTSSDVHQASYPVQTYDSFPWGKLVGAWSWSITFIPSKACLFHLFLGDNRWASAELHQLVVLVTVYTNIFILFLFFAQIEYIYFLCNIFISLFVYSSTVW